MGKKYRLRFYKDILFSANYFFIFKIYSLLAIIAKYDLPIRNNLFTSSIVEVSLKPSIIVNSVCVDE